MMEQLATAATLPTNSRPLNEVVRMAEGSGSVEPDICREWLMGFPLGWTDLGRSAMRSSRKSRR